MYDIIFIGTSGISSKKSFEKLKSRFPTAKQVTVGNSIVDTFRSALKKSFTKLCWIVWADLDISDDFNFDYVVPKWDEEYVHVFGNSGQYNGVLLLSKTAKISDREISYRFFVSKKEIDINASSPKKYDKFYISTYDEYLNAKQESTTEMFWVIPTEVEEFSDFDFNLMFDFGSYESQLNHVFKNKDVTELKYNGIMLLPKKTTISKKEFDFRFLIDKKEYNTVASQLKLYDIVFISYNEEFADANWELIKSKFPRAKRVHGIKGIHHAHIEAAKLCTTPMFWVIDADAKLEETFDFSLLLNHWDHDTVYVWRSRNPINGLEYGYGGVKLLPRILTLNMDLSKPDMTTSISTKFKAMPEISNTTAFNTDAFSTWRSAFRECAKLSSGSIDRHDAQETADRLAAWLTYYPEKMFSKEAAEGAYAGKEYGHKNAADPAALALINDFDWLKAQFEQTR